jgi:hypothetical protein
MGAQPSMQQDECVSFCIQSRPLAQSMPSQSVAPIRTTRDVDGGLL